MITLQQYIEENTRCFDTIEIILNNKFVACRSAKQELKKPSFNRGKYYEILKSLPIDDVKNPAINFHKIYMYSSYAEKEILKIENDWYNNNHIDLYRRMGGIF